MWQLDHDDIMHWCETYEGAPFHSILTDPPYELNFMGKKWDSTGLSFRPELWYALAQHLHPGAFIMAFASSRGWHRMACAIEDAGFVLHSSIFCWNFLSGFPKATRIGPALDRRAGLERPVMGRGRFADRKPNGSAGVTSVGLSTTPGHLLTGPASEASAAWEGYRYGLQALKPAIEPIIVAQWPYQGAPVECIDRTGAGALNIEGGRIDGGERPLLEGLAIGYGGQGASKSIGTTTHGRWPANFILGCAPACNGTHVPECPAARLGEQSGYSESSGVINRWNDGAKPFGGGAGHEYTSVQGVADSGTAARMFYQAQWALDVQEQLDAADPVAYVAKASTRERNAGLDSMPAQTVDDGRKKSIDNAYQRGETERRNIHPTIKPIALARYLATLLLPPARYAPRRILIPFAGSGSEMAGASLAGWDQVIGVERDAEYIPINEARNRYWAGWTPEAAAAVIAAWSKQEEPEQEGRHVAMPLPLTFED